MLGRLHGSIKSKDTHCFTSQVEQSLWQPEVLGLNPNGTRMSPKQFKREGDPIRLGFEEVLSGCWVGKDWRPAGGNGRDQESNGHRCPGKRWLGPQSYDRDTSGVREDLKVNWEEVLCSSSG